MLCCESHHLSYTSLDILQVQLAILSAEVFWKWLHTQLNQRLCAVGNIILKDFSGSVV